MIIFVLLEISRAIGKKRRLLENAAALDAKAAASLLMMVQVRRLAGSRPSRTSITCWAVMLPQRSPFS